MPILRFVLAPVLVLSCFLWLCPARAEVLVSGLQCEYLTDPLGIDVQSPRLAWKLSDTDHTPGDRNRPATRCWRPVARAA